MDRRWQKVREIFDDALRREPDERPRFVAEACGKDKSLLVEVETLLASLDSAESFLETPAAAHVADAFSDAPTTSIESGKRFNHYEIIKQIGAGGMGEVYLAEDKNLERRVAVKILNRQFGRDESNLRRFIREAKSASALNHPNILVVHEVGAEGDAHYIVSEYIKGKTLRERLREFPLPLAEITDIAIQTAHALAAAHEAHIVHRDIKPENIMLRPDGFVKVLDFGLAKLVEEKNKTFFGSEDETAPQNPTAEGVILGTINYMSPEQARGLAVDARTDIWSLGVCLYEMLTGKTPFAGATTSDTISRILTANPAPLARFVPDIPDELERIVGKTLRKDRDERYQNIKDLLIDLKDFKQELEFQAKLERSGATAEKRADLRDKDRAEQTEVLEADTNTADAAAISTRNTVSTSSAEYIHQEIARRKSGLFAILAVLVASVLVLGYWFYANRTPAPAAGLVKSIAVLPLKPINQANRDELYEVGIAETLITRLGLIKGFVVRPLSAIRRYADIEQDPIAAGREQQVDYVLASNYQLAGGRIRVTAQLWNVATGQIEETYKGEKNAGDVFVMQDAVAEDVGRLLQSRFAVASNTPMTGRGTVNEEAYRLYLQGMYFYDRRTRADAYKAIEVLQEAVRLDPNYARAWAGLAHAHRYRMNLDVNGDVHADAQKLMEAVNRALTLDSNVSEAYSALCDNKLNYEYDFAAAETACRRAVELKPDSAVAYNIYSRYLVSRGRFDEAITAIKTAIDLEPTSYFHQLVYSFALAEARRYDEAFRQMDLFADLSPANAFYVYASTNSILMTEENPDKAFERLMKYLRLANMDETTMQLFQTIYQTDGWKGILRKQALEYAENPSIYKYDAAVNFARIGDKDKAMEFLEKSYQRREFWMVYLQVEPRLDNLRDDPRFVELVKRVESK